jgi:hypothetical protein
MLLDGDNIDFGSRQVQDTCTRNFSPLFGSAQRRYINVRRAWLRLLKQAVSMRW